MKEEDLFIEIYQLIKKLAKHKKKANENNVILFIF